MARRIAEPAPSMRLEVWKGDAARARLESPGFREQWEQLYSECPWASVFQGYAYTSIWYDVYRRFTPLLVGALDDAGSLRGLLALAVGPDGEPIAAGGRQAEYQVWLSRPGEGDAFIEAALQRLAAAYPGRTLTFSYLPPDTPRGWLASRRGIARWCVLRPVSRGIMDVSEAGAEAGLMNKNNRIKLKRLERVGPVVYERLMDPVAIDSLLEEIIPLCDLRQGALHDVLPFRADPLKLPFHRALVRAPGLLCVSVLRCGDQIASVQIDADNRGQLAIGFGALSPSLTRHSPGRLHTLFRARDAARQGHRSIDLTPGGAYKDFLASRFDEVYTLHVFLGVRRLASWHAADAARRAAKALIIRAGADPTALRERVDRWKQTVDSAGPGRTPVRALRALKARLWADHEVQLYEFDARTVAGLPPSARMRVDCFADLVSYRRGLTGFEPRRAFLRRALSRLERGAHVYTHVEGPDLVSSAWVSTWPEAPYGAGLASALPPSAALVHDLAASPALCRPDEWVCLLPQLVRAAAALPGVTRALVAVPSGRRDLREASCRLGGTYIGSVFASTRGGRTQWWSAVPQTAWAEPTADVPLAGASS
ncbi:MAG: GNAT family N-acetyltransferase [Gemmatimonadota bacterium]|nr:GNAT family N-acetyltransferase [Gemmatimonadota bacterium]